MFNVRHYNPGTALSLLVGIVHARAVLHSARFVEFPYMSKPSVRTVGTGKTSFS